MIHYHGTPITPQSVLLALTGRNFCVSYANPGDLAICHKRGQSVMLDNGAFSIWRKGHGNIDVDDYWLWAQSWLDYPTTWCVIPDIIDGDEIDNDRLIGRWFSLTGSFKSSVPVWHVHESLDRLDRLVNGFDKVCIGSSGEFSRVGSLKWLLRMDDAFDIICRGSGRPRTWVHMLRGLSQCGSDYPFASADSTNIASNHFRKRNGVIYAKDKAEWARSMADRIDSLQCQPRWYRPPRD